MERRIEGTAVRSKIANLWRETLSVLGCNGGAFAGGLECDGLISSEMVWRPFSERDQTVRETVWVDLII